MDILNLKFLKVIDVKETATDYFIQAEQTEPPFVCNNCGHADPSIYGHGHINQQYLDTPIQGKIVGIAISISGDISYALSPEFKGDTQDLEALWIDEGRIEVVSEEKVVVDNSERKGGAVPSLKVW